MIPTVSIMSKNPFVSSLRLRRSRPFWQAGRAAAIPLNRHHEGQKADKKKAPPVPAGLSIPGMLKTAASALHALVDRTLLGGACKGLAIGALGVILAALLHEAGLGGAGQWLAVGAHCVARLCEGGTCSKHTEDGDDGKNFHGRLPLEKIDIASLAEPAKVTMPDRRAAYRKAS
jgi:hypothetical protein